MTAGDRWRDSATTMRNNSLKEEIMRTKAYCTVTLLGLFLVLAAASARAQVNTADQAVMNIPFDFYVGGTHLPAGRYIVGDTPMLLLISRKDGRESVRVLPVSTLRPKGDLTAPKLIFHRYGERYFLSEVWMFAEELGYKLRQSHAEREELAKDSAGWREVTLIARR
jgi:hypothetical protein